MAINPEAMPPNSSRVRKAINPIPRWIIFGASGLAVLCVVHHLRNLPPLLGLGLLLVFIFNQAKKVA